MSNYRVLYKDVIWNCISLIIISEHISNNELKTKALEVVVVDETNRIKVLKDDADNFQFIKR